jgi:hypothetical protein
MQMDDFLDILEQMDSSDYGMMVKRDHTDQDYFDAQRREAGLMDWTSHFGTLRDGDTVYNGKDARNTKAWRARKHLAKIVIDGLRFDRDHLDEIAFAENDHMRELGGLVATYYKRNQIMHGFFMHSAFYDYFRDWTKNDFDNSRFIDETLGYNMDTKSYSTATNKFNEENIKNRRSEFIKFWADHFSGKQSEDNRATYNWSPSDEDLEYWIERDWFNYFLNDEKRFDRVADMFIDRIKNNKDLKERLVEAILS